MCGIGGGVNFKGELFADETSLQNFSSFLKYRGPDQEGSYIKSFPGNINLALVHKRLAIIDKSELGIQPMTSYTGKTIITCNGEIYNYKELKKELESKGYSFVSNSDTEVILNGYECWGIQTLIEKIDGMFAMGLYDIPKKTFYLIRDRFGKKPLYYHKSDSKIFFSSDIRSFKTLNISLSINNYSLGCYFREMATPRTESIWNEIKKVPPGSYIQVTADSFTINEYWNLDYSNKISDDFSTIVQRSEELLINAVNKRKIGDVSISSLLSGGIDSSLITSILASSSSHRINTYSVGFMEKDYNELPYSKQVAQKYNTQHTEIIIGPKDFSITDELIAEYGEPFADSSMIPSYFVCKSISKNHKVTLSGDGGDELFGGYDYHTLAHILDRLKRFSFLYPVAEILEPFISNHRIKALVMLGKPHTLLFKNMGFDTHEMKNIFSEKSIINGLDEEYSQVWKKYGIYNSFLDNFCASQLKSWLINDYLVKMDRASMFASVEVRSPFLDKELAEYTSTIPNNKLLYNGNTKAVLKEVAKKYLPKGLIHRTKMGFGIPVGEWFRKELKNELRDVILGTRQNLVEMDYLYIEKMINRHLEGEDLSTRMWILYVFHKWVSIVYMK